MLLISYAGLRFCLHLSPVLCVSGACFSEVDVKWLLCSSVLGLTHFETILKEAHISSSKLELRLGYIMRCSTVLVSSLSGHSSVPFSHSTAAPSSTSNLTSFILAVLFSRHVLLHCTCCRSFRFRFGFRRCSPLVRPDIAVCERVLTCSSSVSQIKARYIEQRNTRHIENVLRGMGKRQDGACTFASGDPGE